MGQIIQKVLALSQIQTRGPLQHRSTGLHESHVEQIESAYRKWLSDRQADPDLPCPVERPRVFKLGELYVLTRGHHRVAAAKACDIERMEFEVYVGFTEGEARKDAASSHFVHKGMPLVKKEDRMAAFLDWYDEEERFHQMSDQAIADEICVSRTTVSRWLKEHDKGRANQTERVGKDGVVRKVDVSERPKADKPDTTLFDGGETPPAQSAGQGGGTGEAPSPEKTPAKARAGDEYPPDPRFMPNAEEAEKICTTFASVKATLEGVRKRMRELLPDKSHPVATQMIDLHGQFSADLNALIETLGRNKPEAVCPLCVGTTLRENGDPCQTCNRYGLMGQTDADGNKSMWKRTGARYDKLVKFADVSEVEA